MSRKQIAALVGLAPREAGLARSRSMAMALLPGTPQDDTKSIHRTGIAGALLV